MAARFGKFLGAALVLIVGAEGCKPTRRTADPSDYYSLIRLSLEGGQVAAFIGRNKAIAKKDFAACVASDVLAAAFESAADALHGKLVDMPEIPSVDLDVSGCLVLQAETVEEGTSGAADGPSPETVEEAVAPEPSPDIIALVEGLAGVALVAAKHYGQQLKDADCRKGTMALAAIQYVEGMVKPITDEIASPDGKVTLPAAAVDLSSCDAS